MSPNLQKTEAGFSLLELLVAMALTIVITALAGNLLASSFKFRSREDRRSDAIADVQRALNIMTREIANAGFALPGGLPNVSDNGLVAGDTNAQSIRIVSNLNGSDPASGDTDVADTDEDVKFLMYVDNTIGQRYIVRHDRNASNDTTVLANRIDSLVIRYYDEKVTYGTTMVGGVCDITDVVNSSNSAEAEVSPANAKYIVIAIGVTLPAVGTPNVEGYQPPSYMPLTSTVVLRNSIVY